MSEHDLTLLTAADAAAMLGIDPKTFRGLGAPYVQIGAHRRYTRASLRRWVERQKGAPGTSFEMLTADQIIEASRYPHQDVCGVYFLVKAGRVVYVGQSNNVYWRVGVHRLTKDFDAWHWVSCPREELTRLERRYIDLLVPQMNQDSLTVSRRRGKIPLSDLAISIVGHSDA
jgi:hypothetical protein